MVVSVSLSHQQIYNTCKIEHESTQRCWILIFIWCFILLLPCITTCRLMDMCLVSLRPQYPPPKVFSLPWWWWLFFLIVIIFILVWFLCLQHTYLNSYHRWVQILFLHRESCACEPWFLYEMNFMSTSFTTLCYKHWLTGVLVKILRNVHSLSQIKFIVVVNLFVNSPSHKPSGILEKSAGERGLILRLKRIKTSVLRKIFFRTAWKHIRINGDTHSIAHHALLK